MVVAIKLIVGLGNPGKDYQGHRHNVGFWFCDALAHLYTDQEYVKLLRGKRVDPQSRPGEFNLPFSDGGRWDRDL